MPPSKIKWWKVDAKENEFGCEPLQWAARRGHLQLIRLLLNHGAKTSYQDKENRKCLIGARKIHLKELRLTDPDHDRGYHMKYHMTWLPPQSNLCIELIEPHKDTSKVKRSLRFSIVWETFSSAVGRCKLASVALRRPQLYLQWLDLYLGSAKIRVPEKMTNRPNMKHVF